MSTELTGGVDWLVACCSGRGGKTAELWCSREWDCVAGEGAGGCNTDIPGGSEAMNHSLQVPGTAKTCQAVRQLYKSGRA